MTTHGFQQLVACCCEAGLGAPMESHSGSTGKRTWRTTGGFWVYWFDTPDKLLRAVDYSHALVRSGARAMLLHPMPGAPAVGWSEHVTGTPWSSPRHDVAWMEFIETLHRVHSLGSSEDWQHPQYLHRRLQAVDSATVEQCRSTLLWTPVEAMAAVDQWQSLLREVTWCHRDLARRNLLVDDTRSSGLRVGWIDFEHARRDTPVMEWGRLWREFPDLCAQMWLHWNRERLRADRPGATTEALLLAIHLEYWATVRWLKRRRASVELQAVQHELTGFRERWESFMDTCRTAGSPRPEP